MTASRLQVVDALEKGDIISIVAKGVNADQHLNIQNTPIDIVDIEIRTVDANGKVISKKIGSKTGENSLNGAESWMDDIFNLQKSVVNQNKNIIANSSRNAKGAWGEMACDAFLTEKGFQPLHPRKSALTEGWEEKGIDGVFKKNGQYYILEAKYTGSATLNVSNDGKQLSKTWIEGSNRLRNATTETIADEIKVLGYKKIWAKVAPDGTITFKEATDDFATTFIDFIP